MKSYRRVALLAIVVSLTAPALCQDQTVARLGRESRADISRADIAGGGISNGESVRPRTSATVSPATRARMARASVAARAAAQALFINSEVQRARLLSQQALQRDPQDIEALFVRMEVAGLEAEDAATLDAAVQLCEAGAFAAGDPRVRLAAARVRESAANTPEFHRAIPRLRAVLANSSAPWPELQTALLNAAMDGAPGLNPYALSRAAGILTDWRIVGFPGLRPLLDLQRQPISPSDDLAQNSYQGHAVENFQFADGWIRLPDYLARRGVFYGAGRFASLTAATWKLSVESAAAVAVYVDGQRVPWTESTRGRYTALLELTPGPHRVMVEFAASAAPLRVAVAEAREQARTPLRAGLSLKEAAYLLAAEHYVGGEFGAAIRQIDAVGVVDDSAALQFLRAQAWAKYASGSDDAAAAWHELHARFPDALAADQALAQHSLSRRDFPTAMKFANAVLARQSSNAKALAIITQAGRTGAADAEGLWARRLTAHPSCDALREAVAFYAERGRAVEKEAARQRLDGCAPESLDYAQSLSHDGNHGEAARALRRLLSAAPLNRAARLMRVRELQLSGDEEGAQRAAAEWVKAAPNAENYHGLAAAASDEDDGERAGSAHEEFYQPYRRDAAIALQTPAGDEAEGAAVLLEDHVAVSRPNGSVSLYVHTARRLLTRQAIAQSGFGGIPQDARILTLRVLHADGTATELDRSASALASSASMLSPGDTIDAEYALYFAGDGGIPEHAEAFQFVFGNFDEPVLNARFVVLTPADRADGGVVISSGEAPPMTATVRRGMLQRVWEKETPEEESRGASPVPGIVRVVEQDNGWAVPSNAEHQRRIETIHPGPRAEDS